jgi:hypothetical protein
MGETGRSAIVPRRGQRHLRCLRKARAQEADRHHCVEAVGVSGTCDLTPEET